MPVRPHIPRPVDIAIDRDKELIQERRIALFNHGGYSLFEPVEMIEETKAHFRRVLTDFLARFPFNPELFD